MQKELKYGNIIYINYKNQQIPAIVKEIHQQSILGRVNEVLTLIVGIYNSSEEDLFKDIEINNEDVVGNVPDGLYSCIYDIYDHSGIRTHCTIKNGDFDTIFIEDKEKDYYKDTSAVIEAVYSNNLNLRNKKVVLEESGDATQTDSLELGQIVELRNVLDTYQNNIITNYGIIISEFDYKKISIANSNTTARDGISGYTGRCFKWADISPIPKGNYKVKYQQLSLPVTDRDFLSSTPIYKTVLTTGKLDIKPDYKYRILSVEKYKSNLNFKNKGVQLEESFNIDQIKDLPVGQIVKISPEPNLYGARTLDYGVVLYLDNTYIKKYVKIPATSNNPNFKFNSYNIQSSTSGMDIEIVTDDLVVKYERPISYSKSLDAKITFAKNGVLPIEPDDDIWLEEVYNFNENSSKPINNLKLTNKNVVLEENKE